MGRPGIMLYFDMLEPIRNLSDAERGRLLTAILEYGKEGTKPAFRGKLALAWGFVQPKIDRDESSYDDCVMKRKYASFCSKLSQKNLPKVDYEEWREMNDQQRRQMLAGADGSQHVSAYAAICTPTTAATTTTTTSASTTTNTNTNTKTAIAAAADAEEGEGASLEAAAAAQRKKIKKWEGELGKGVVYLTEEQFEDLLDRLGLDCVDRYVTKLADFILKNGADVKNHYKTILSWYDKDRAC